MFLISWFLPATKDYHQQLRKVINAKKTTQIEDELYQSLEANIVRAKSREQSRIPDDFDQRRQLLVVLAERCKERCELTTGEAAVIARQEQLMQRQRQARAGGAFPWSLRLELWWFSITSYFTRQSIKQKFAETDLTVNVLVRLLRLDIQTPGNKTYESYFATETAQDNQKINALTPVFALIPQDTLNLLKQKASLKKVLQASKKDRPQTEASAGEAEVTITTTQKQNINMNLMVQQDFHTDVTQAVEVSEYQSGKLYDERVHYNYRLQDGRHPSPHSIVFSLKQKRFGVNSGAPSPTLACILAIVASPRALWLPQAERKKASEYLALVNNIDEATLKDKGTTYEIKRFCEKHLGSILPVSIPDGYSSETLDTLTHRTLARLCLRIQTEIAKHDFTSPEALAHHVTYNSGLTLNSNTLANNKPLAELFRYYFKEYGIDATLSDELLDKINDDLVKRYCEQYQATNTRMPLINHVFFGAGFYVPKYNYWLEPDAASNRFFISPDVFQDVLREVVHHFYPKEVVDRILKSFAIYNKMNDCKTKRILYTALRTLDIQMLLFLTKCMEKYEEDELLKLSENTDDDLIDKAMQKTWAIECAVSTTKQISYQKVFANHTERYASNLLYRKEIRDYHQQFMNLMQVAVTDETEILRYNFSEVTGSCNDNYEKPNKEFADKLFAAKCEHIAIFLDNEEERFAYFRKLKLIENKLNNPVVYHAFLHYVYRMQFHSSHVVYDDSNWSLKTASNEAKQFKNYFFQSPINTLLQGFSQETQKATAGAVTPTVQQKIKECVASAVTFDKDLAAKTLADERTKHLEHLGGVSAENIKFYNTLDAIAKPPVPPDGINPLIAAAESLLGQLAQENEPQSKQALALQAAVLCDWAAHGKLVRPNQLKAIQDALAGKPLLLKADTAEGKTMIIRLLALTQLLSNSQRRIGIITHDDQSTYVAHALLSQTYDVLSTLRSAKLPTQLTCIDLLAANDEIPEEGICIGSLDSFSRKNCYCNCSIIDEVDLIVNRAATTIEIQAEAQEQEHFSSAEVDKLTQYFLAVINNEIVTSNSDYQLFLTSIGKNHEEFSYACQMANKYKNGLNYFIDNRSNQTMHYIRQRDQLTGRVSMNSQWTKFIYQMVCVKERIKDPQVVVPKEPRLVGVKHISDYFAILKQEHPERSIVGLSATYGFSQEERDKLLEVLAVERGIDPTPVQPFAKNNRHHVAMRLVPTEVFDEELLAFLLELLQQKRSVMVFVDDPRLCFYYQKILNEVLGSSDYTQVMADQHKVEESAEAEMRLIEKASDTSEHGIITFASNAATRAVDFNKIDVGININRCSDTEYTQRGGRIGRKETFGMFYEFYEQPTQSNINAAAPPLHSTEMSKAIASPPDSAPPNFGALFRAQKETNPELHIPFSQLSDYEKNKQSQYLARRATVTQNTAEELKKKLSR